MRLSWGKFYMKTKIIYISGSEVFEMSEIRAAFDQVRATLGLDSETILFGVPVDAENALTEVASDDAIETMQDTNLEAVETVPVDCASACDVIVDKMAEIVEEIPEPIEDLPEYVEEVVVPETVVAESDNPIIEAPQEVVETTENIETVVAEPVAESAVVETPDTVIPILSVLSVKGSAAQPIEAPVENVAEPVVDVESVAADTITEEPETIVSQDDDIVESASADVVEAGIDPVSVIDEAPISAVDSTITVVESVSVETTDNEPEAQAPVAEDTENIENFAIDDMIDEEMPVVPVEKTLEQLLESMTPLREDVETHLDSNVADQMAEMSTFDEEDNDTDATLAKLASEFAEKQDTITPSPKGTTHGKISKLKGMIPFSKQRHHEDNSLMGDLFNWAGMAANDDEYSFSGFFSPLSKRTDE